MKIDPVALLLLTLAIIFTVIALLLYTTEADAHDWYTGTRNPVTEIPCCTTHECRQIRPEELMYEEGGYRWLGAPETAHKTWLPMNEILPSRDEGYHACMWRGTLLCIFLPAGS